MKDDKIALFDMDGTLVDYDKGMIESMAKLRAPGEPEVDLWKKPLPAYAEARLDLIRAQPCWWRELDELPLGFELLEIAKRVGFHIHILTQGPRKSAAAWKEKVRWCHKHLGPDVDVTITRDKGLVYGRILVDDYPRYITRWLDWRPRGLVIMPVNNRNLKFFHPNVIGATPETISLSVYEEAMRWAYARETGPGAPSVAEALREILGRPS